MDWVKQFNSDYANAVQAITPLVLGVISWIYFKLYKESKLNEGDAASIIKPIFWTIGDKYRILAVHKYEASNDISGYRQLSQNSRPDQWEKLIHVQTTVFGLRHEVIPRNATDILDVIISRDGAEKWKVMPFNK